MCLRYTITVLPSDLELWLHVKSPNTYKPRFNAAPNQILPIVTQRNTREIVMAYWGFPKKAGTAVDKSPGLLTKSFNTVKSSKSWRKLLQKNRCLILADGYYCWKQIGNNRQVPFRIIPNHRKLICFTGIWKEVRDPVNDVPSLFFILITRPSYKPVDEVCEQMPVIIEPGKEMTWLDGQNMNIEKIIDQMEIEDWALLEYYSVSPLVHNPKIDNPDLIRPTPATDQLGNLILFD